MSRSDVVSTLHRIERVADLIANDKTAGGYTVGGYWNVQRATEIKTLAQVALRQLQEPVNNGK